MILEDAVLEQKRSELEFGEAAQGEEVCTSYEFGGSFFF